MALDDARLEIADKNSERIGIALGSALGGIPMCRRATRIFIEKGLKRVDPLVSNKNFRWRSDRARFLLNLVSSGHSNTIGGACAAGADSVGYAFHAIKNDLADVMITGALKHLLHH